MYRRYLIVVSLVLGITPCLLGQAPVSEARPPIIDMHMHTRNELLRTESGEPIGLPCSPQPCEGMPPVATRDRDILLYTLKAMDQYNIVKAVISDGNLEDVYLWKAASPDRFLAGRAVFNPLSVDMSMLRAEYEAGKLEVMGEIASQYGGYAPNDPALEPFFALAEEFDVPVLIHTAGLGGGSARFKLQAGHPLLLEEVVIRHPKLRIYVENAGWPFLEEMVALMYRYPNVYADLSTITWVIPRVTFHEYLEGLIDARLGKRLMFGSDQMHWPDAIGIGIEAVEAADFLTDDEKRDIFYNNAARFLRLEEE